MTRWRVKERWGGRKRDRETIIRGGEEKELVNVN